MEPLPSPFRVHVEPDGDRVVIRPEGEIDLATADDVRERLDSLRQEGWRRIVIDLATVSFIDSTGLRLLVEAQQASARDSFEFSLTPGSPQVMRVLEISGVNRLLTWDQPS